MKFARVGNPEPERRPQLTREQVVTAAIELADRHGIESISMRRLAKELGVEAMSLYTHVRNKDDLLDGMVDAVIRLIPVHADPDTADWRSSLREMALGARRVMLRHPWAPHSVETRTAPGPAGIAYVNSVLGILREGGFSVAQAHHALHILGSHVLGFTQTVFDDSSDQDPAADGLPEELAAALPYVAEMALAVTHGGALGPCDDDDEFEFALDFILDGLQRLRQSRSKRPSAG
ncbi:MAG: TetR/AcrR family transcriptional regulator C-terminal domain-containing protein [Streptosporangiaceae bacterium]